MHLVDAANGVLGGPESWRAISPWPRAAAWAAQAQGGKNISVVFFGDGATGAGAFHETLNLAALWRLPVLFVCENNGVAEFTSREEHSNVKYVSSFAAPYAISTKTIDGNDLPTVWAAAREAIEALRRGGGPYLLECMTFRMAGHYVGDSQQYRSKEELAEIREKCPIERLKRHLVGRGFKTEELDAIGELSKKGRARGHRAGAVGAAPRSRRRVMDYVYRTPALAADSGLTMQPTFIEILRRALDEELARDPRVHLLGEDVAGGRCVRRHQGPGAEAWCHARPQHAHQRGGDHRLATGAALCGLKPVLEIMFIDFATLSMDCLVNQTAKYRYMSGGQLAVPLVVRTQAGAAGGAAAQHSQSLEACSSTCRGLVVVAPSTPAEAYGLLKRSIRLGEPVLFVEHKRLYPMKEELPEDAELPPIGRARIARPGTDVTVIAYSAMVQTALEAGAETGGGPAFRRKSSTCGRCCLLDMATITASVAKTHRALVAHEAVRNGGGGRGKSLRASARSSSTSSMDRCCAWAAPSHRFPSRRNSSVHCFREARISCVPCARNCAGDAGLRRRFRRSAS